MDEYSLCAAAVGGNQIWGQPAGQDLSSKETGLYGQDDFRNNFLCRKRRFACSVHQQPAQFFIRDKYGRFCRKAQDLQRCRVERNGGQITLKTTYAPLADPFIARWQGDDAFFLVKLLVVVNMISNTAPGFKTYKACPGGGPDAEIWKILPAET